jgi:hypothetical protein
VCVLFACGRTDHPAHEPQVARSALALEQGDSDGGTDDVDGGSDSACTPVAEADTTCDGTDDDCDGQLDEDCDYGPSQCPSGTHVISGTAHADWLIGTPGPDCILGYGGDDILFGLGGDDVLIGGPGSDFVIGGAGHDVLLGGAGDDWLDGGEDGDVIEGGDGNDVLQAEGDDVLHGGACNDRLYGFDGAGSLYGDSGSDLIVGQGAAQVIDGGDGYDSCSGAHCETTINSDCFEDADCSGGLRCVLATGLCVPPGEVAFEDVTCDGVDDDCDGKIDEDFQPLAIACGTGACARSGTRQCEHGQTHDACTPGTPAADDTSCNGIDDDCDGAIDDDFTPVATSCGTGVCARSGAIVCVQGQAGNTCTPGTPAADDASCNGSDDDCDGNVDEDFATMPSSCGTGACARSGVIACIDGVSSDSCTPGTPAADDASCNGIDDDCDGVSDEDYASLATSCEVGGCLATGQTLCWDGSEVDSCVAAPQCIAELACSDQTDNDGDGAADCADSDCAGDRLCQHQSFALSVPAMSNIWGAGHAGAPGGGWLPPAVTLQLSGGAIMTFASVTGLAWYSVHGGVPPDGLADSWSVLSLGGIAGYSHATRELSLLGVFLGPTEPVDPAPAQLHYQDSEFTQSAPLIGQMFVIGDGLTSAGVVQRFVVPQGATRLFLGLTDSCSGGSPSCYDDNSQGYTVQGELHYE